MFRASFISGFHDFTWHLTSGSLRARLIDLTNKKAKTVLCSVIKHARK